ncbi:uncharacterized protein FOMMEDRAFT_122741 [Fomitiporia mediterranea MF3/22]|uniref:uncharacterized protein n=1 Tax=Fomitiporia mediterranea (strain MF3/22) TaxID=694068 RepID=UPI0004409871|nr:uncharacterized protein FOMMEDRAFT_122741 [Fomitiporia mediterranea MF3/22]EJD02713.1 hypothetical protein FOMMEDRAFT_122741 [Fomitiporia mediterranea MF3/22]
MRRPIDADEAIDGERPRKRVNINNSGSGASDLFAPASPPSPDIMRAGQKRRPVTNNSLAMSMSMSSDESSPDNKTAGSTSSKSRIVRGKPVEDKQLVQFRIVHPGVLPEKVNAAYYMSNKDIRAAGRLLMDPDFNPSSYEPTPSSSPAGSVKVVGKVKEVEDEREAKRAQQKQIAAKSSIYRNRRVAESPSASTSSLPPEPSNAELDSSPVRPRAPRRPVRKNVVDSEDEDGDEDEAQSDGELVNDFEQQALNGFNELGPAALQDLTGCTQEQVDAIISLRPFGSVDDLRRRLGQGRKKAGSAGISSRLFDDCVEVYVGYGNVDQILRDCERIGKELKKTIDGWTGEGKGKGKDRERSSAPKDNLSEDGALSFVSLPRGPSTGGLLSKPPSLLSPDVVLKDYQLTGISWLRLLHSKGYSCILADEMGLGKTVQVISFFAQLKEEGCLGPHLIVVPASTLENWCREFERFAPSISIEAYYGKQDERRAIRGKLFRTQPGNNDMKVFTREVLITTYSLAVGKEDKAFLKKIPWNTCVFDEGHVLKNFRAPRYSALTHIKSKWKLLLTGTPLQNNLQELVSIMGFILPDKFGKEVSQHLRTIFKVKGDSKQLLNEERVKRAKTMMTPFVLRRRKDQVLKDLPRKTERIEWCSLTALQKEIYDDARQRSRKAVMVTEAELAEDNLNGSLAKSKHKGNDIKKDENQVNSSNVLMDLRKAALHPMLFRVHYTDAKISILARLLMKEPDYRKRNSRKRTADFDVVFEELDFMSDSGIIDCIRQYKSTQKHLLDESVYLDSGKVRAMLKLLDHYKAEGRKCLIFSQFTQVLDILRVILDQASIKYLLLTGSTPVDVRQGLVDQFTEDESIPVFLLSTKAGGMGINLTAASVVILFDQDFNPHNDRQAADRAYRIGQKRDVEIVKLITSGTIEEDMFRLGQTKLALDEAVAGDVEDSEDSEEDYGRERKVEKIMRASLMDSLRKQFEEEENEGGKEAGAATASTNGKEAVADGGSPKKSTTTMDLDSDTSELTDLEDSS